MSFDNNFPNTINLLFIKKYVLSYVYRNIVIIVRYSNHLKYDIGAILP